MLRFLFVTMVCLALASCKTAGEAPAENTTGEAERSIYYKSQAAADTALAAFDKDNPSCQLWTNWQKMCSRTGEGGAASCIKGRQLSVKPSTAPFAQTTCTILVHFRTKRQHRQASSLRFCQVTKEIAWRDEKGAVGRD